MENIFAVAKYMRDTLSADRVKNNVHWVQSEQLRRVFYTKTKHFKLLERFLHMMGEELASAVYP